jgi:diadenylate cyclase
MAEDREDGLRDVLAMVAPGTALRGGIERILRAGRGALIVLGGSPEVAAICSGGFTIDVPATSQRIAELAKMDGALVLDADATRILRANVQLVPDPSVETAETGTRHRSAERTARQTGCPVVAVSEAMGRVSLYHDQGAHIVEEVATVASRADQALSTLERYRARLDDVLANLSARELADTVTVRDVLLVVQRAEMLRRIAEELDALVVELGTEGRLIALQLAELIEPVDGVRELLVRDYLADRRRKTARVLEDVADLSTEDLLDAEVLAGALAFERDELDRRVTPRGYRLLTAIPRLPGPVVDRLVERFATLPRVLAASIAELDEVEGVGGSRARAVKEGLERRRDAVLPAP